VKRKISWVPFETVPQPSRIQFVRDGAAWHVEFDGVHKSKLCDTSLAKAMQRARAALRKERAP
jgi:hypothetical protein